MPDFMLKRLILAAFPEKKFETEIANSIDFMVEQLETLPQRELASRLILNTQITIIEPSKWILKQQNITIIDVILTNNQ